MPRKRGLFIVFEGIEGAGKSTQIERVAAALRENGTEPLVTREPGGTRAGEAIRRVALDRTLEIDPLTELLLMLAARAAFVAEVVEPALAAGTLVLSDRYDLSTLAYQGGGRGLPIEKIRPLNQLATHGLAPDLYVLLDIDVDVGLARLQRAETDRIERAGRAFHERVAQAYRDLATGDSRIALVDAAGEINDTFREVWRVVSGRFPETFPPS